MAGELKYNSEDTNLIKFKETVTESLAITKAKFPDYNNSVESANKSQEQAQGRIVKVIGISMIAILLILALNLNSIGQPSLVVLPVPLGILGAVWAFYLHDLDLSLIGMVGLLGVAVNGSIIMVIK